MRAGEEIFFSGFESLQEVPSPPSGSDIFEGKLNLWEENRYEA
jgi:hypothetical protein